jgi:hypothetical protein
MVLEVATIIIKEGTNAQFEEAIREGGQSTSRKRWAIFRTRCNAVLKNQVAMCCW